MKLILGFVLVCFLRSNLGYNLPNGGKIWALLVAGSNGYDNYRHQADVCHAYQILHKNGIPDENIIVMMYDDIANSTENPRQGIIINKPGGQDVYAGVLKDYTGETVNSTNFLKILTGDEEAMIGIGSGRVIKSGPNDHVFVNFVDHGAPGLLAFPEEELYATDLEAALQEMVDDKKFAKMVLYVEACESGSMFDNILPDTTNIFVTTAADPHESSYACYFDETLNTYLGDVYSVKWMEDAEKENLLQETLHHQYETVRTETNTSHVEEYGDLDLGSLHVAGFMGFRMSPQENSVSSPSIEDAVPSHHVPVAILQRQLEKATHVKEKKELSFKLHKLFKLRRKMDAMVKRLALNLLGGDKAKLQQLLEERHSLTRANFPCYKKLASYFSNTCYNFAKNPYALRHLFVLVNVCAEGQLDEASVLTTMDHVCSNIRDRAIGVV